MTIDPDAPAADGEERAVDLGAVVRRVDTAIGVVRPDGTMVELTEAIEAITGFPPGTTAAARSPTRSIPRTCSR